MDLSLNKDEDGKEDHQDPAGESTDENQTAPTSKSNHDNHDQTMDNLMVRN